MQRPGKQVVEEGWKTRGNNNSNNEMKKALPRVRAFPAFLHLRLVMLRNAWYCDKHSVQSTFFREYGSLDFRALAKSNGLPKST